MSKIFKLLFDPHADRFRISDTPFPKPDTRHDIFIQTKEPMSILYRKPDDMNTLYILNPVKEQELFLNVYQVPYESQKDEGKAAFELARSVGTGFVVPIPHKDVLSIEDYEQVKNIQVYKPAQEFKVTVTGGKSLGDRYINDEGVVRVHVMPDDENAAVISFKIGATGSLIDTPVERLVKDEDGSYYFDWQYSGIASGAAVEVVFSSEQVTP